MIGGRSNATSMTAVVGSDPDAYAAPHLAFALENALVKARPPAWLYAAGPLAGDRITSGSNAGSSPSAFASMGTECFL